MTTRNKEIYNHTVGSLLITIFNLFKRFKGKLESKWMQREFRLFESGRNCKLYGWNVAMRQYQFLDGRPRQYVSKQKRKENILNPIFSPFYIEILMYVTL